MVDPKDRTDGGGVVLLPAVCGKLEQDGRIDGDGVLCRAAFGAGLLWVEQNAVRTGNAATTNSRLLWLSALAAGAAVATKWTAVAVVLLPLAIFLAGTAKSFRALPVFCLLAAIPVLPWLVKNWLLMANPTYPLFDGIFHNPHWSAGQAAVFAGKHYASFGGEGWRQSGSLIAQYSFSSFWETGAVPLLMTAPLILLLKDARGNGAPSRHFILLVYAGWFLLTFRPWRFLFPGFALAAIVRGANGRARDDDPAGANHGWGGDAGRTGAGKGLEVFC